MSLESTKEESTPSSPKNSYTNDAVSDSIEAQVAWKGAVEVVVALIASGSLAKEQIEDTLETITKKGIQIIANR